MPHINSIRLVNVHFNNATQFYDDFYLEPAGRNTTYDLENGGGKTLLLMMLLQVVLPKTYLRREKPLSLLFQGGKDRTSHVVVEWILEEGHRYKYLLTGFSARKRRGPSREAGVEGDEEEGLQSADIEHRSWLVFYNDHRVTSCRAVPLVRQEAAHKRYATFEDIRKYIQQMEQKGLPGEIFDGIERYQHYLASQHLLTAEWNIIRGINSGENNIESYFRQNTTSRKLIENLFVKIVEDVEALNRGGKSEDESLLLADALIEIRTSLNEYLRLKGHLTEFGKIGIYYNEFAERNGELLAAFQKFEAAKGQAAAIYNLLGRRLQELGQQLEEIRIRLAEYNSARERSRKHERLLEAGLVNLQKEILQAEENRQVAARDQLAAGQEALGRELRRLLAWEGYGEYREVRARMTALERRQETLAADEDSLQAEYNKAGGQLKYLSDRQLTKWDRLLQEAQQAKNQLEKQRELTQEDLSKARSRVAVLQDNEAKLSSQEEALSGRLQELRDFFLQRGELAALLSIDKFAHRLQEQLQDYQEETVSLTTELERLAAKLQDAKLASVGVKSEVKGLQAAQKRAKEWLAAYRQEREALENKARAWEQAGIENYREALQLALHQESLRQLEMEIETRRMRRKKQLSTDKGFYVPNEEILILAEQLGGKCPYVQTGMEWIGGKAPQEKERLLRQMPFLPFSVIVDGESFGRLQRGGLKLDFTADYPVPVVNLELLRGDPDQVEKDLYYICSFADLLLDKDAYQRYIHSMEEKIQTREGQILAGAGRVEELGADLAAVALFMDKYPRAAVDKQEKVVAELGRQITEGQERWQQLGDEQDRLAAARECCRARIDELAELAACSREKMEMLREKGQKKTELAHIRRQLQTKRQELQDVFGNIAHLVATGEQLKEKYRNQEEQLSSLTGELFTARQEVQVVAGFEALENNLPLVQARASFQALKEAVGGRSAEEKDLQAQLSENKKRLAGLLKKVQRDYGHDLAEIEKKELAGQPVIIPTPDQIVKTRQSLEDRERRLGEANNSITKISGDIKKLEGRLAEILKDFTAEQQLAMPCYEHESRYRREIARTGQLIHSYEQKIKNEMAIMARAEKKFNDLGYQRGFYQDFLARESVENSGVLASELKDYQQFEKEYRRRWGAIQDLYIKWDDRLKTIQAETAAFVIREPLAELAKIGRPESLAQCQAKKAAFDEYQANIAEQVQKITNDIGWLESYQADFTRRCIQRAELVLGHIKKLEALSRIEVYGRRINMIELRLREFEAKDKQMRMKEHIDRIVRDVGEEGQVDRKRIAAWLSTKELLARIADMDRAAVRLYKVESIGENSRFYRWEHAIGSEGQNNSLYFIFAACLISFIRMLSITTSEVRTKKVIIVDNPFGATSAVYLWEPMFKILQQNDIQLIAPGHRIPREITSRFAVSYLLNQDILQDGRRRVVIKDVRSEEDEEVLRYVEPEQLAIFK